MSHFKSLYRRRWARYGRDIADLLLGFLFCVLSKLALALISVLSNCYASLRHIKKRRENKKIKSDLRNHQAESSNNRDNNMKVDTKENENDAVQALIVLGFSKLEAKHRVKKVLTGCNDMTLEELICHSLR